MTDRQRRRAEDEPDAKTRQSDQQPESEKTHRKRSARDFFHRFRQPLVGIGIVGAAAPMIKTDAGEAEVPKESAEESGEKSEAGSTETKAKQESADLEEAIAGRIAKTRGEEERDDTVSYAIDRYGIARDLAEAIYDQATEAGIEPKLAYGLVKTESAFRHNAISNVGARGLTQVMPRTAKWLRPGTRAQDLYDRQINLSLGFRYLNQLIDKYGGDVKLALLAYNRGPGTVDKILKRGGDPDNGYARKVMDG